MTNAAAVADRIERELAGVVGGEVAAISDALRAARTAEMLVFTRFVLVPTNFERSLYADPEWLSVRWDRLIEQATGEPLTATHFGRDIAAA